MHNKTHSLVSTSDHGKVTLSSFNSFLSGSDTAASVAQLAALNAQSVNLSGNQTITGIKTIANYMKFTPLSVAPTHAEGTVFWDDTDHTLNIQTDVTGTTIQVGQEQVFKGRNVSGSPISNGKVVRVVSAVGNRPTIAIASNATEIDSSSVIGVTTNTISDNSNGYVTVFGLVRDMNTNSWTEGDLLYLGTNGDLTNIPPFAPQHSIRIGYVTVKHLTQGQIFVRPVIGYELNELHDVYYMTSGMVDKDMLEWNNSHQRFEKISAENVRNNIVADYHPNGLEDNTKFSVSYDSGTRVFTLTVSDDTYIWYGSRTNRTRKLISAGSYVMSAHADASGSYHLMYDSTGTLVVRNTAWNLYSEVPLYVVYYNANAVHNKLVWGAPVRELHTDNWPDDLHYQQHITRGAVFTGGGIVAGYVLDNNSSPSSLTFSVTEGMIFDEDLQTTANELLEATAKRIVYRSGTNSNGEWDSQLDSAGTNATGTGILGNNTDLYYNQLVGGTTWQLTPVTSNNRWVCYYLCAFPLDGSTQYWTLMGQTLHTTLASAQAEDPSTNIIWGTFPLAENTIVAKFIYRRQSGGASGTNNAQLDVDPIYIRSSQITVTDVSPTDHQSLSNRSAPDAHPITSITDLNTELSGRSLVGHTHLMSDITDQYKYHSTSGDMTLTSAYFDYTIMLNRSAPANKTMTLPMGTGGNNELYKFKNISNYTMTIQGATVGTDAVEAGSTSTVLNLTSHVFQAGQVLLLTSGTYSGEYSVIISTTVNSVTVENAFSGAPSASDTLTVYQGIDGSPTKNIGRYDDTWIQSIGVEWIRI